MDILEEIERESEPEMHAEFVVAGTDNEWRPFKIEKCCNCGKTPSIVKNLDIEGDMRYKIHCCGITASGSSETAAIYEWNWKRQPLPFNS